MPPKRHPIFSHSQKLDIFFLSVKKNLLLYPEMDHVVNTGSYEQG